MKNIKISERVSLEVNEKPTSTQFIPKNSSFEDHSGLLEKVGVAAEKNMPILLIGETGTGKTSVVRHLAQLTNNNYRRVNHNGGTSVEDIVGRVLINKEGTYWVDGVLIDAMRNGYWYLADEINSASAEINFAYHSLLDDDGFIVLPENNGEVVRPHPNFRFFAAMNPPETYAGTKELNHALMSRFLVINADFAPPATEVKILTSRTGVAKDVAENMVEFAVKRRAAFLKGDESFVFSTRELLLWAKMFSVFGLYTKAADLAFLNKIGEKTEKEAVADLLGVSLGKLDQNSK